MEKRLSFLARAAMMLLLAVFTTMTAWATNATPLTSTEGLKLVPGLSATGSNNYHSGETEYRNLFDGEASTSWHYYKGSGTIWEENGHTIWGTYVEFQSASACIPVGYRLTTSNSAAEHPEWNPTSWRLMAKANSSDAWTTLAEASEDHTLEAKNCQPYNFAIAGNTTAYKYFRFEITEPTEQELAELSLWEAIDPNEQKYSITLPTNLTHGTIDALVDGTSCTEAYQGDRVKIRVTWMEGYDLAWDDFSIEDADGNEVYFENLWREEGEYCRSYAFAMPASNVTVNANIDVKRYQIDSPCYGDDGKTFSISPRKATANETVTLTITKLEDVLIDNIVAWYNQDSGGGKNAPLHRMRGDDSAKDDGRVILELTKVDETHYTFLMPAAEVYIATDLHYEGKYGVRAASGMDDESFVVSMDNISAVAANAGDELWVSFNTDGVENLTIAGETTTLTVGNGINSMGAGNYTFTMPAEAVEISADLLYPVGYEESVFDGDCWVEVSVDGVNVPRYGHVAPGKTVTLKLVSKDAAYIFSYLYIYENKHNQKLPYTKTGDDTYTFVMPACGVDIRYGFGNPVNIVFEPNGGTGEMADMIIGQGGTITLPACGFTAPEGCAFEGWYEEGNPNNGVMLEGSSYYADWNDHTLKAIWAPTTQTLTAKQVGDKYWTTFYGGGVGYAIDNDAYACAYTATLDEGTLTLHKLGKVIPAGTAVIIVSSEATVNMALSTDEAEYTVENSLRGVSLSTELSVIGNGTFYVMGNANGHFGFHEYKGTNMAAHKAFLFVEDESNNWSSNCIELSFDEEDEITSLPQPLPLEGSRSAHWYTLDGRKLQGEPATTGIYIYNGKKIVK